MESGCGTRSAGRPSAWRSRPRPMLPPRSACAPAPRRCGLPPADSAGLRRVLLGCHRRNGCHRLRAGPRVHYSHRIDLGQTVVGDLRWIGYRDHTEQPRQPVAGGHHHVHHLDHVDHDDLVHDHNNVDVDVARRRRAPRRRQAMRRRPRPSRRRPPPRREWARHRRRRHRVRRHLECRGYQPLNSAGRRSTKLATPSVESRVFVSNSWPMASS